MASHTYLVCFVLIMAMYKIATINVEGLHRDKKRIAIFQNLIKDNFDIIALQETHCTEQVEKNWKEEWPGKSTWTKGKSNQNGLAFLFNKNLDVNILDEEPDIQGRIFRITVKINGQILQLINFYGAHATNQQQSEYLFNQIQQYICEDLPPLLLGDFNMVEDIKKDRKGGMPSKRHTYGLTALNELKDDYNLIDIWREMNPNKKTFTWQSRADQIQSRLDRIYIPASLAQMVAKTYIKHFVWSDHDMCVVELSIPTAKKKGSGYWKLNTQYLESEYYRNKIEIFWKEWQQKKENYEDIKMWWDLGKIYIKSITIQYAQELFNTRRAQKEKLLMQLECERHKEKIDKEEVDKINQELKELEMEKNKKIFIHTHTMVRETDEVPNRYFYGLLRLRQTHSTMDSVLADDGKLLTEQSEIISEAKNFYEKLYTEEKEVSIDEQNYFLNQINKTLSEEQKQKLESEISLADLEEALRETQNEKTAGYDGLPYEFYKTFWNIIKNDFLEVTKNSLYTSKELTLSQTKSILILIYKNKEKKLLINWRPISLLCCDYKILSKALANKLKQVLATILSNTQTANVPNRTIFNNLFLVRDIIEYCNKKKVKAYILSIDQEKAFDKLNRKFLIKILQKMNFGPKFIESIEALYKNNKGHVLINGFVSITFNIDRGVRQGCPISAMLYDIYIETLALAFKSDPEIHGIPIPGGKTHVISQYADDTDLLLSQKTKLYNVFKILNMFQRATGSTINSEKTKGLCIGIIDEVDPLLEKIQWKNIEGMEILGVYYFADYMQTQNYNWRITVEQFKTQLQGLKKRKLSLKGKVLVLNTVVMSKIWYLATVIPMTEKEEKIIRTEIFAFLWDAEKKNPIKQEMVYQPKEKGGLNLKSPKTQQIALQIKFIKEIVQQEETAPWVHLARYWLGFFLAPLKPEWSFLRDNSLPKADVPLNQRNTEAAKRRPKYYDDLLYVMKTMDAKQIIWTTAYFNQELTKMKYQEPTACRIKWNSLGYDPLCIWKMVYHSHAGGRYQDVHYKFLHRIIPSKEYIIKIFFRRGYNFRKMKITCKTCPRTLETIEHIFFNCYKAKLLWNFVYPTVYEILKTRNFKIFHLTLNKFPDNISIQKTKMVITLIQITLHTIWINRNKTLFDKVANRPTIMGSRSAILYAFYSCLKHKFQEYMPNSLAKYKENFCHTPRICTVLNDVDLRVQLL